MRVFNDADRPGAWPLKGNMVCKLRPREDRFLRAAQGPLWVTLSPVPAGASCDHIVMSGERLLVRRGQTAVVSIAGPRGSTASFDWDAVPQPRPETGTVATWRAAFVQMFAGMGLAHA